MSPAQRERLAWAAARLIVNPGLAPYAAEGFLRVMTEEARRLAGDASFGDLAAASALSEFLFVAAQIDLEGAR